MKTGIAMCGVIFMLVAMCGFANAYTVGYEYALEGDGISFTSNVAGATVESFNYDAFSQAWTWTGDYDLVAGSLSSRYAAPYGDGAADPSFYLTVPKDRSSGSVTASNLGGSYNYFGLWWGSVDTYNSIRFYNGGTLVQTITGSDITNPANGNQTAPSTNLYVNFFDLESFDSFTLTSTSYAFEVDNIAVGTSPVPEPSTMLLLGCGLLGLAWYGRKRKQA